MKLNPDCVRDLLLYLEEKTEVIVVEEDKRKLASFRMFCPALLSKAPGLSRYSVEEIIYHTVQLSDGGYIVTDFSIRPDKSPPDGQFRISTIFYLTPSGHELAAKLRDGERWSGKIKPALSKAGAVSLSVIEAVASVVTSALIKKIMSD